MVANFLQLLSNGNINELHISKWKYDSFVDEINKRDTLEIIDIDRYPEIAIFYIKVNGGAIC